MGVLLMGLLGGITELETEDPLEDAGCAEISNDMRLGRESQIQTRETGSESLGER